eukprot:snap_masked-scaffold_7-processed-gene-18.40-mRNA-1 protein AED:0.12 eAED:0.12 QI:0/0/0/1/1/1/3/0/1292
MSSEIPQFARENSFFQKPTTAEEKTSILQRVFKFFQLDTCFWLRRAVSVPPPGQKPKLIRLDIKESKKEDIFHASRDSQSPEEDPDDEFLLDYRRTDNEVRTYKYTIWNFLPKATAIQFKRFANTFYLVIVIFSIFGESVTVDDKDLFLVPYNPTGVILLLLFVIIITLLFEGFSDYSRHKDDQVVNNQPVIKLVYSEDDESVSQRRTEWRSLKPGDIVKIYNKQKIPADILFLYSSVPDASDICYIETSGIDGETNLKIKNTPKFSFSDAEEVDLDVYKKTRGIYEYEQPNSYLQFAGRFTTSTGYSLPLQFSNLILRGSELRNTPFIYGMVMYAGMETKLILSKKETPQKFSSLDKFANPYLLTFAILFSGMIPITMYTALEVINFMQSQYVNNDPHMVHNSVNAKCRANNLVSELGQVTHIISDKTGTLTKNSMKLVGITAQTHSFGLKSVLKEHKASKQPDAEPEKNSGANTHTVRFTIPSKKSGLNPNEEEELVDFATIKKADSTLFLNENPASEKKIARGEEDKQGVDLVEELVSDVTQDKENREEALDFVQALSLCHTILVDHDEKGNIRYNSEGPDEEALVIGAQKLGYTLIEGGKSLIKIRNNENNEIFSFEVLAVNSFNSTRKRMSLLLKNLETGKYELLMKGAENFIFDRTVGGDPSREKIEEQILKYAWAGFRGLVYAGKTVSKEEAENWLQKFNEAASLPGESRKAALSDIAEEIEKNVRLLGATAIEDELQYGVKESIVKLREAGIKILVATGDKVETAINIALSCRLLDSDMLQIELIGKEKEDLVQKIDEALQLLSDAVHEEKTSRGLPTGVQGDSIAIIVTGSALEQILAEQKGDPETQRKFYQLTNFCEVLLGCRVSPKQKSLLVKLINEPPGKPSLSWMKQISLKNLISSFSINKKLGTENITLAIGDGANDVSMIQAAHIGVGISGKEGLQAANNADFSIAQFRFIVNLLVVHGSWNYRRNTKMVKFILYSWVVLTMTLILFTFYCLLSGQLVLVNPYYQTLFGYVGNIIIALAALSDRYVSKETLLNNPWTYFIGQKAILSSFREAMFHCVRALLHGCIIFFLAMYFHPPTGSLYSLGAMIYNILVFAMMLMQIGLTDSYTVVTLVVFLVLLFIYLPFMFVIDDPPYLYREAEYAGISWATSLFVVLVLLSWQIIYVYVRKEFFFDAIDVLIEIDRGYFKSQFAGVSNLKSFVENSLAPIKIHRDRFMSVLETRREGRHRFSAITQFKPKFNFSAPRIEKPVEVRNKLKKTLAKPFKKFSYKQDNLRKPSE